jgi:hypothetical protein
LNVTLQHQCVDEIEWYTPPSVFWWNWMIHTSISVLIKIEWYIPPSVCWWKWCVSFNFINTLMVVCIIQFHQHTDGGVCHSISLTHWWWSVSFNFSNTLIVEWWMCATYSTISVLMKLDDELHNQCVDEIEWYTPPSVCWWNWVIHTTISVLLECVIQFH